MNAHQVESLLFHSPLDALPHLPLFADAFGVTSTRYAKLVDTHFYTLGTDRLVEVTLALERHGFLAFSPYRMFVDAVNGVYGERVGQTLADVLIEALPGLFEAFDTSNGMCLKMISDVITATKEYYDRRFVKNVIRSKLRYGY